MALEALGGVAGYFWANTALPDLAGAWKALSETLGGGVFVPVPVKVKDFSGFFGYWSNMG
jgi:hypothetical protein